MAWTAILPRADLAEGGVHITEVGRKQIGVMDHEGELFAVLNFCPHAGAPICKGRIEAMTICREDGTRGKDVERPVLRCPWHHWEFALKGNGRAVAWPQAGPRLKLYPVRVADGVIEVDV